jgi:membrane-bound lytic murein transglycosylase F
VRDARRLARQLGLNPNVWFGNVERAILLLSRPQYAQTAQHGYCRCGETVRYVRDVRSRYNAYVAMKLAESPLTEEPSPDARPPGDSHPRPRDAS